MGAASCYPTFLYEDVLTSFLAAEQATVLCVVTQKQQF